MHWSEVVSAEPVLGRMMREQLIDPGVLLVGSIRRDGRPRLSGVEPLVMGDDLWLCMMPGSMKAQDLRRDPRLVLNSVITDRAGERETKVEGSAREELDRSRLEAYSTAASRELGWQPVVGQFALFQIDLETVTLIGYSASSGEQHVARWPEGEEFIRPAITPTSLGPATPVRRIFGSR